MENTAYPNLQIDLQKLYKNAKKLVSFANANGINITGVVKGSDSSKEVAKEFIKAGCMGIADSRIEKLAKLKEEGIKEDMMLLRVPMLCEVEQVVRYSEISLNSEIVVLEALNIEANNQNKIHKVILMADLGDLREGYFDEEELIKTALHIETKLDSLHLYGVGTNLGCFGAICPDESNLGKLAQISEKISALIGRKLEIVSGGATTSLPLLFDSKMPKGINHLRVGEAMLLARDLIDLWGYSMEGYHTDTFVLEAQVIEVKEKPSHPIGRIFVDAFGNTPEYEDKGMRKRALIALGKKDIGHHDSLIPKLKGITVEGSSSDHVILDVTDAVEDIHVGDIIEFELYYQAMLYLTASTSVKKIYRG